MRKATALFLSLLLVLCLPLQAFAASDLTLRIIPGAELLEEGGPQLEALFGSLYYKMILEGSAASFSLQSDNGELISVNLRSGLEGFYFSSPIVGDRTLYISTHDAAELIRQYMENATAEPGAGQIIVSLLPAYMPVGGITALCGQESVLTELLSLLSECEPLLRCEKTVTEGSFAEDAHDPATKKTVTTVTAADIAALFGDEGFQKLLNDQLKLEQSTAAQLFGFLQQAFWETDFTVTTTVLSDGDKVCSTHHDITYSVAHETASGNTTIQSRISAISHIKGAVTTFTAAITSTNGEAEPVYSATYEARVDNSAGTVRITGEEEGTTTRNSLLGSFSSGADGLPDGWFAYAQEGYQFSARLDSTKENGVSSFLLSLTEMPSENGTPQEPPASGEALLSFSLQMEETEAPEALTALAAAVPEGCLQLLRLSEEQLQKELQLISGDAMRAMLLMMSRMPPELRDITITPPVQ